MFKILEDIADKFNNPIDFYDYIAIKNVEKYWHDQGNHYLLSTVEL